MSILSFTRSRSQSEYVQGKPSPDEQIVRGIQNHDDAVLGLTYRTYFQNIRKMVYTFRNTTLDPEDIFQEGLTRAVINVREGKFREESSFSTYLNSICRNICLKQLASLKNNPLDLRDIPEEAADTRYDLLPRVLGLRNRLDDKCRTIIDLRFSLTEIHGNPAPLPVCPSFDEIAERLSLTSENARQRFKRCMDKFREFALADPEICEYFEL